MTNALSFTLRDVIVAAPFLLTLLLIWVRFENRITSLETSMEDIKRLVLNGHSKKTPIRRKT